MRPVNKPSPPSLQHAAEIPARSRPDALTILRMQLQDTIGYYCSLCEMPITVTQAVTSKKIRRMKKIPTVLDWSDLLLACDFCQLHRTSDVTNLQSYLWPDTDSTFSLGATSPFVYTLKDVTYIVKDPKLNEQGSTRSMVIVSANPNSNAYTLAQSTIDLFQLNTPFYDSKTNSFTITTEQLQSRIDPRVEMRTDVWNVASIAITTLQQAKALSNYPSCFAGAARLAAGLGQVSGFWSVWMTRLWQAFPDEKFIRQNLIQTYMREGYQVVGYQTEPDGGSAPWTIFTGTAGDRITF